MVFKYDIRSEPSLKVPSEEYFEDGSRPEPC